MTLNDLEPQKFSGFSSDFFAISGSDTHLKSKLRQNH